MERERVAALAEMDVEQVGELSFVLGLPVGVQGARESVVEAAGGVAVVEDHHVVDVYSDDEDVVAVAREV